MRVQDLYFGVLCPNSQGELITAPVNLFDIAHTRYYAAKFRIAQAKGEKIDIDPAMYVFGDVWSRCEYEMLVSPLFRGEQIKVDLYQLYVVPQREILFKMIDECSVNSCKQYIRDYKKRFTK